MVGNSEVTSDPEPAAEDSNEVSKETSSKKKTKKSKSGKKKKVDDVQWDANGEDFDSGEEWAPEDTSKESPSTWDPKEFSEQTDFHNSMDSDIDSEGSGSKQSKAKKKSGKKNSATNSQGNGEVGDGGPVQAWKMRESWKSSSHGSESSNEPSKDGSSSKRGRKKDLEPAMPRRSRGSKPDAEAEEIDQPPSNSKSRVADEQKEETDEKPSEGQGLPRKPKRRSSRVNDDEIADAAANQDELPKGSFHKLTKDFDKKPVRSSSRNRKTKTPGSGSGRRRRIKDKGMDNSGHSAGGDDDTVEVEEIEREVKLKGGDEAPGSGGPGRRSWRDRRAQNRLARDKSLGEDSSGGEVIRAPGSGGRRPPGRASSERWMRAVENVDDVSEDSESFPQMGKSSELSRSAHSIRRYHSGGLGRMTSLDRGTYHGDARRTPHRNQLRTPMKSQRTPRKALRTPDSADSGGGSFGGDDYEYEMNLSGRSARTLDSIEDLEDFEHIDFQTPGMVDMDEEIYELMQKNVPEKTGHLQRRVHRKREAVNYDQSMPMMTRQALMTRTASSQVMRQYVDGTSIDRRRLMLRSDSTTSMGSTDELSMSQHRQLRGTPGRRPPPRTRSSGMAAMTRGDVPGFMQQPPRSSDPDDRRRLFRTKSSTATSSFKQYQNKPNRVASLSRRPPGAGQDTLTAQSAHEPTRGVGRAKSMSAARRPGPFSPQTHLKPERRVAKTVETKSSKEELQSEPKTPKKSAKEDESSSEDSDVESDEELSPKKAPRRKQLKEAPVKAAQSPVKVVKKKATNKRDMTLKRNRERLHAILYEAKMGVDMKDLFRQVQQGDIPRSPIKTLMMPSP